jgi:hypothetical protein
MAHNYEGNFYVFYFWRIKNGRKKCENQITAKKKLDIQLYGTNFNTRDCLYDHVIHNRPAHTIMLFVLLHTFAIGTRELGSTYAIVASTVDLATSAILTRIALAGLALGCLVTVSATPTGRTCACIG